MSKTSLEYTELMGLNLALSNMEIVDITYQDEEWLIITNWLKERIKELQNK